MYQAWQWGGTSSASPTSGFVQPNATTQVAATQWPAGYSQYAVSPELQQQWAAAWATHAQYAYGGNVPVGDAQTTTAFTGAYPDYQTATTAVSASETKKSEDSSSAAEKPKNAVEQPPAQDLPESDKIKQLKEQAEKWSNQQPASSWSYSAASTTSSNPTTVIASNDSSKALDSTNVTQSSLTQSQMTKEEEEFERQFKDWEKQFETWRQQNQNHPDKEAFAQYEKQWQEYRAQLLQNKEQLQKAKSGQLANAGSQGGVSVQSSTSGITAAGLVNTQTNSTTITDSTSTSTTAMYYQHPQYMYMQPYVYPGATTVAPTAVAPAVVPQTVVPPAVVPPSMVTPAGVPPVTVPPAVLSSVPQQMPYNVPPGGADSYGNQPHMGMSGPPHDSMNYDNYENDRDMYNYGPGPMRGRNGPRDDGMGPNYEGFDNSNMPEEADFQRENWKFGRGRGRGGRGRVRGRGRWSEPTDMDRPGGVRNQRKTLLPGGPGTFPEEDGPPPYEYPTEDCRDQFVKDDRHRDDRFGYDGAQQYPHNDSFQSQPFDEHYPPDPEFPDRFPRDRERFPPDRKRFPPDQERFPDNDRFPPDQERFPPGREGFMPGKERFPRNQDRYPPDEIFPPDDEGFPPEQEMFPPDQERFPPAKGGRYPPEDDRYDNSRFPPEDNRFPRNEEGFPPERFPPRHGMEEGGFGERDFNEFPPEDEMFGPPPFRDDFPPFDERGGRGRGRFSGRGRRFRGDFERFGPPYPPRMRNDQFGPPDDRFGFPGDGPPRMPPPRGMRPPFDGPPPFGPRGRFPDEPFFGDGPGRYKSIDYTHRPASAVMGDDFNPHYEYESEFQDDVNAYRDNFNAGVYLAPHEPIIFSQVNVESFDYGHGMKPMTTTTIEAKESFKDNESSSSVKGFEFPYQRDRSPSFSERNVDYHERDTFRDRDRDGFRSREKDRSRERNRDGDRDRDRDRDHRDSNRDSRDRDRDSYDRGRSKERDIKRDRDWDSDVKRDDEKRFKWDKNHEHERDFSKDKSRGSSGSKKEIDSKTVEVPCQFKPQPDVFKNDSCSETVLIEDILVEPKRSSRPKQLVIILRGLPGSGKTYFARLIKDKEVENGGSAPRILSLDDYFMVETEITEIDPDTGKRVKRKEFKFEYEYEMEEAYRSSLFKSFKKTIDDRFFPFIIVDAVHEKSKQYEEYWSYAKQKGFQVYIAEMDCKDPVICHKRNIHNRTLEDINKILQHWEPKPRHFIGMDVRSLLQDVSITEVEMEVESSEKPSVKDDEISLDDDSEESNLFPGHEPSRWEKLEATEEKLDQLDGLRVNKKKHSSMEDYLQLPDDYDERKCEPGKKRVRWADLEQRKEQDRLRAIGFVVGQTDWTKLTDPTQADKALTKTKYF